MEFIRFSKTRILFPNPRPQKDQLKISFVFFRIWNWREILLEKPSGCVHGVILTKKNMSVQLLFRSSGANNSKFTAQSLQYRFVESCTVDILVKCKMCVSLNAGRSEDAETIIT